MILSWDGEPGAGPALGARVEEYDAFPPVASLLLDALPARRLPDREAIAGYLAFGRWASGDITLPAAPSPFVAEALEKDAHPVRLRARGVEYTPRAVPRGERTVTVRFDLPTMPPEHPTLALVPSTAAHGVFAAGELLVVPSNAFVLDHAAPSRLRARLAVAVLFSADIDADLLQVPPGMLDEAEHERLARLLQSVNLELDVLPLATP